MAFKSPICCSLLRLASVSLAAFLGVEPISRGTTDLDSLSDDCLIKISERYSLDELILGRFKLLL